MKMEKSFLTFQRLALIRWDWSMKRQSLYRNICYLSQEELLLNETLPEYISIMAHRDVSKKEYQTYASKVNLTEKVDCTVATISSYETGRTVPDIDTIINMAGVLNVTVYWIIGLDEGMNSILYAISRILKLYSREQQRAVLNIFSIIDKYLMSR